MNIDKNRRWICLSALAALHFADNLALPLLFQVPYAWRMALNSPTYAIQISQPFLLAISIVFGSGHIAIRLPRAAFAFVLLSLVPAVTLSFDLPETDGDFSVWLFLISRAAPLLSATICFIVVNNWLNWCIAPLEMTEGSSPGAHRGKLALRELICQSAGVAVVVAACRAVPLDPRLHWSVIPDLLWIFGQSSFVFLPLVILVLQLAFATSDARRLFVWSSIVLAATCGWELKWNILHAHWEPVSFYTNLTVPIAFCGSIFGSLWLVRLAGFRLLRKTDVPATHVLT
ncbi:MAG: hypothetical protein HY288_12505 [Planctomycetia bacterium]|nr:hypothetical protein [Planctomycetia bacterium]